MRNTLHTRIVLAVVCLVGIISTVHAHAQNTNDLLSADTIFDTLSVDLKVNGSDGPVEVAVGSRITVSWESEGAKRCKGNWSKKDLRLNGKITGKLSRSLTGSVTVRIACIDADGNREDDSVVLKITPSSPVSTPTPVTSIVIPPQQKEWDIFFLSKNDPAPIEVTNAVCGDIIPIVAKWIKDQAASFQQPPPFSIYFCDRNIIKIPASLVTEYPLGNQILPFDPQRIISYLENQRITDKSTYVTLLYYSSEDGPFLHVNYNNKYNFNFIKRFADGTHFAYTPLLTADSIGVNIAHEFMHLLGARDKYGFTVQQACQRDISGEEYSGYDIMCHRVRFNDGFIFPPLSQLIVSKPTSIEIGWLKERLNIVKPKPNDSVLRHELFEIAWSGGYCKDNTDYCIIKVYILDQNSKILGLLGVGNVNSSTKVYPEPGFVLPNGKYFLAVSDLTATSSVPILLQE